MENKFLKNKKGLSPIIATVLLIAMVVVIALIVFVWLRGLTEESITKFSGRNIKLVCNEVSFEASYSPSSGNILVVNEGNVPIYSMKVQFFKTGSHSTKDFMSDYSGQWPTGGLFQGATAEVNVSSDISEVEKIYLIPILVGQSSGGIMKAHVCDEQYGYEVVLS
jgi:flagellin-like protein